MSFEEIARTLGINSQQVYHLQTTALKKLRKGLAQRGYGAEDVADLPGWLTAYWLNIR